MLTFSRGRESPTQNGALVHVGRAIFRLQAGQDAVSRDCSRLQLLAAWPVSRGGTTPNPWALSAAKEAAGNHVSYRTLRARCAERREKRDKFAKEGERWGMNEEGTWKVMEERDEAEEIERGEGNEIVEGNVR